MAPEILTEKKAGSRIIDALAISGVAIGSEIVFSPVVGSATLISGLSKMGIGLVSSGLGKNKFTEFLGAGLLVGGSMDLVNAIFGGKLSSAKGMFSGKSSEQSSGSVFV
jgi:hypothetical protein